MRQVATIPDEPHAHRLADYLLTRGISTRVDPSPNGWIVWIHREDRLDEARREVADYLSRPDDPKYDGVSRAASAVRREAERKEKLHRRNSVNLSGRLNVPSARRCPVTYALIAMSVAVAILTSLGDDQRAIEPFLFSPTVTTREVTPVTSDTDDDGLASSGRDGVIHTRSTGLRAIASGQVWRLISPILLHFGILHLVFNMFWLRRLGGLIELRKGSLALLALVVASGCLSNFAEYFWDLQRHGPEYPVRFGGMSGVVYALFGFCWMKSDYDAESDMKMPTNTIIFMMIWLVACMSGAIGPIANAAHVAGLGVGMVVGLAPHLGRPL